MSKLEFWTHAYQVRCLLNACDKLFLSFSTRHAGLVSNEKMFHATDEEIPQRKGPSLSHELRVWEGRRRMLTAATSSKFYGRKPASVAYACQLLSRFFLKKTLGLTLFSVGQSSYLHMDRAQHHCISSSPSSECCISLSNLSRDCVWITEPNSVLITMSQGRSGGGETTDRFLAVLDELAK